jgi:hypothetical protein
VGRALGETDPWGDGSVSGLIGLIKCPTYWTVTQVETSKKMLLIVGNRDKMTAVQSDPKAACKNGSAVASVGL